MSEIAAVVFDWAGTVIDFGCLAPVRALQRAFAAEGLAVTDAQTRKDMGRAKRDHVAAMLCDPGISQAWHELRGTRPSEADIERIYKALGPLMREEAAAHCALIPGAAETAGWLGARGVKVGSSTGYTRAMMEPIIPQAAAPGYAPEAIVCAGETAEGRPSPLPMWKALLELSAYPAWRCIKVDDAVVGVAEGRNACTWAIGVAASGNGVGLGLNDWRSLDDDRRREKIAASRAELYAAGADYVIDTIADLKEVFLDIERRIIGGDRPRP